MKGNRKRFKNTKVDSLVGRNTVVFGDLRFVGGLHVDGTIKGNVVAADDASSVITVSQSGCIEGEVKVHNVVLNGTVVGDVYAKGHIELAANARVTGDVYYTLLEMAIGAEVNGNLVHCAEEDEVTEGLEGNPALGVVDS